MKEFPIKKFVVGYALRRWGVNRRLSAEEKKEMEINLGVALPFI